MMAVKGEWVNSGADIDVQFSIFRGLTQNSVCKFPKNFQSERMVSFTPPFLIVGLGASGKAAMKLLLSTGVNRNQIFTFDDKDPSAQFQNPNEALKSSHAQTIVVSPGYPLSSPWIQKAIKDGLCITSELSLALPHLKNETKIGITGSVGKSTTAALLRAGIATEDPHCFLGGNFGIPLAEYASQLIEKKRLRARYLILELSSYQLENARGLGLDYCLITSLAANHLERYGNADSYFLTKLSIIDRTFHGVILNENGIELFEYIKKLIPYYPDNGVTMLVGEKTVAEARDRLLLQISSKIQPEDLLEMKQILATALKEHNETRTIHWTVSKIGEVAEIVGKHNKDNLAAAIRIAQILGLKQAAVEEMRKFKGLPHRLENLGKVKGIRFINDSKSTTIESVKVAIDACRDFSRSGVLYVLLGGRDKNLPWEKLSQYREATNVEFVFFGECGEMAAHETRLSNNIHKSLAAAMTWCQMKAQKDDTLLLSPGGTSLDEFKNFEDRGNFFKNKMKDF